MKIVIDAMGGDNAPKMIVDGAIKATKIYEDLQIILTGKQELIQKELEGKEYKNISIVDAREVIENTESPTVAAKQKPNSSLMVAYDLLKNDKADAIISAGSTGAILVGGFTKIGRIKGISRPGLAPLLPTKTGGKVLLLDVGANMDCKSINLLHFAIMGSSYMSSCHNVKKPRIGLLNVGDEESKGNELSKEAFKLLKEDKNINFVGNMEARYIMSGNYDVVVADGFAGNIALKAIEGAVSLSLGEIKKAFAGVKGKLAGLMVVKRVKRSKVKLDYHKYGGSPFLGCKKIIIKSHGSSKAETIVASIEQAIHLHESNYIKKLEKELKLENSSSEQ